MFRIVVLAVALAIGAGALPGRSSAAGINDIVSDFLYYQEELKVKAPARPVAEVVAGIGERYLALVDADGAVRVWDFETGGQVTVDGRRPAQTRAIFPSQRGGNLVVAEGGGRVYETAGMSFATKATLLPAGSASDAVAMSPRAPVVAATGGGRLQVYNLVTKQTVTVAIKDRVTSLAVSDDGRFVAYEAGAVVRVLDADSQASLPLEPAGPAGKIRFYYDSAGALGLARQDSPTHLILYTHDGKAFARSGEHTFGSSPQEFWIRDERQIYWTDKNTLQASAVGVGRSRTDRKSVV